MRFVLKNLGMIEVNDFKNSSDGSEQKRFSGPQKYSMKRFSLNIINLGATLAISTFSS